MAFSAMIGALRVALRLDSAEYVSDLKTSKQELKNTARELNSLARGFAQTGRAMTIGLTAPLAAGAAAAIRASANFEAAMIRVGISTKASAAEMQALEAEARKIGKATIFSASEAADAMDMLAKTGLSATQILGGAAKATVDLAAAAGSGLEPAAAAISDAMQQFGLTAGALPMVVNQITGAVNESKLSFEDFAGAAAQAGGVAASLGVSFEDFNTVLAGTSSMFASGSDAGTSFKTFLTTLVPKSNEAAGAIEKYGLSFFDAEGNLRSMSEIAGELQTKLGGLNEEARNEVLKTIFGTDAMRTAIALMRQGAAGLDEIRGKLADTDAAAQAAKRMEGFNGQLEQLTGALEDLGIAIGNSGLLESVTGFVKGLGDAIDKVSEFNPAIIRSSLLAAGMLAAIGPLQLGLSGLAGGLSSAARAMSTAAVGATSFKVALAGVAGFLGPSGILAVGIGAVAAAVFAFNLRLGELQRPAKEVRTQVEGLAKAALDYEKAAMLAATASGEARTKYLAEAAAAKEAATQLRNKAKASLAAAQASLAALRAENTVAIERDRYSARGDAAGTIRPTLNFGAQTKARANVEALIKSISEYDKKIADAQKVLEASASAAEEARKAEEAAARAADEAAKRLRDKADASRADARASTDAASATENLTAELRDYIAALDDELATRNMTAEQVKIREIMAAATKALTLGEEELVAKLLDLVQQYRDIQIEAQKADAAQDGFIRGLAGAEPVLDNLDLWVLALDQVEEAYYRAAQAGDDIYYGIRNRDWVSAFGSLLRAIQMVRDAFSDAGTAADRIAAVAGLGQSAGQAIGGKAGSALSGAASGFAAGNMIMPGIGGIIGGVLGGLGGLFGASKAKKRAKKEAEERARQEAAQKAAEEAAKKRELEIRLMELAGDAAGVQAAREADLLAALSPANQELMKQVLALEKEAEARALAAEMAELQRGLEIEYLQAAGQGAEALRRLREDELAELPEALRPLKQAIYDVVDATEARRAAEQSLADLQAEWADRSAEADERVADARQALADAAERDIDALEAVRDRMIGLADGLRAVRQELDAGTLGGLDIRQQAAYARREMERLSRLAAGGDEAALGALPDAIRAFADTAGRTTTSKAALDAQLAIARKAAKTGEDAAVRAASAASAEIAEIRAQTGIQIEIRTAAFSIADGLRDLNNALHDQQMTLAHGIQALQAATLAMPTMVSGSLADVMERIDMRMPNPEIGAAATSASSIADMVANDAPTTAQVAERSEDLLAAIVVATRKTAMTIEDVTQGGDSFAVTDAPP